MSHLHLLVVEGPDKGQKLPLEIGAGKILGRHHETDYRLNDPRASRRHCEVQFDGKDVKIIDYGSTAGTFVNGRPIVERLLRVGDLVQIGDTQIRLDSDAPVQAPKNARDLDQPADEDLEATGHPAELQGRILAHFQIGEVIGAGASGMVFEATDNNDGKPLALKVMHPDFSQSEEEMQRFVRAMKTMMPLQHLNLVQLYGAGKNGPYCWMSMELVKGENMAQVLERIGIAGRLDWKYAYRVAVHIGGALEYAHHQHVIHRNITPTNILMDSATKTAKLGDLMLARALEGSLAQQVTKPGQILGSVKYMSPERTHGSSDAVDGRSDLFSLGATIYALLAGKAPFTGGNMLDTISAIRHQDPERPSQFQLGIPGQMESVVMKLLAKKPEDRYQNATELLKELDRVGKFNGVKL